MLHLAAISRVRKLSTLMIKNSKQIAQNCVLSISINISVTNTRTQRGPRRAYKYRRRVPRTVGGKQGGTEVPADSYRAALLPNYPIDNN